MERVSPTRKKMDPLRTAVAAKGVELSALFFVVFEQLELPGTPPRKPRLTAPHGPSTGGGKMSRQHISLEPSEGESGPTVVIGWADPTILRVELRSFDTIVSNYYRRFGMDLDIPKGAYRRFVRKAESFFQEQGFTIVEVSETGPREPQEAESSQLGLWLLVLFTTLVFGICLGMLLMFVNMGLIVVPSP